MAILNNTIQTRVQLKSDTEAKWEIAGANGFTPLLGELIIYTSDDTHSYSRVKIGDGNTNINVLPFVDAGTINGETLPEDNIVFYASKSLFPYPGASNKLYIDLSNNRIYYYTPAGGYGQLSNFIYNIEKTSVSNITYWRTGSQTKLNCNNGILNVTSGVLPSLNYETISVVKNINKEVTE